VPLGQHHVKIADLMNLERQLLSALSRSPSSLTAREEAQLRWALALARVCLFRAPSGEDIDLGPALQGFRAWLREHLREAVTSSAQVNFERLRHLVPSVAMHARSARRRVLEAHVNDFGAEALDRELRHRKLGLVLGGGGGSGFAHLGVFQLAEDLGVVPELIVGASMGSLLGLFRALERSYSPAALIQTVPNHFEWNKLFRPFNGVSRFGFPGVFHMQLLRPAASALENFLGSARVPAFEDLPIRLEVVVTGVRTGFPYRDQVERELQELSGSSFSPFAVRRRMKFLASVASELAANPRMLRQLVFGQDEETRRFNAIEAVGFSCAVPGLFCYDVFHDDPQTVAVLEGLVRRHSLWRMADGGVVNNVPSRVAWESVMRGNLGTRNVFLLAADVFAPTNSALNLPFTLVQQIARANVVSNKPFSDYHKTFQDPPSPVRLIPNWRQLEAIQRRSRAELEPQRLILQRALATLPPFDQVIDP
jgi:predicted acylesterase/phospholipase RssA